MPGFAHCVHVHFGASRCLVVEQFARQSIIVMTDSKVFQDWALVIEPGNTWIFEKYIYSFDPKYVAIDKTQMRGKVLHNFMGTRSPMLCLTKSSNIFVSGYFLNSKFNAWPSRAS